MNVTFRCPSCDQSSFAEFDSAAHEITCSVCGTPVGDARGAATETKLLKCVVCPSQELFIRKDFSQKLGVTIVVIGFVASTIAWYYRLVFWTYGFLFATALIDVVLYFVVGNLLECYRCHAQYREVPGLENHEAFDLETHEKYRQQAARLGQAHAGDASTGHTNADASKAPAPH